MGLDSFDQYDSDTNVAIVNQFGDSNTSMLIQSGVGNMARFNIFGNRNTTGLEQDGSANRFILNLEGATILLRERKLVRRTKFV